MKLLRPTSLAEALQMLRATPDAVPIAGGTDLMVSWPARDTSALTLLDLSRINGAMRRVVLDDAGLQLGGLATYWQVLADPTVGAAFPLLGVAARQVGAIQIQTRGTWAGNIANGSPAADGVPVLMAYDATVTLQSVDGTTTVPLSEYYTGYKQSVRRPDQLITAITMPRRTRRLQWFHKVGARSAQAITKVGVALVHGDTGWRVVANSVAPAVCRCRAVEQALDGGAAFTSPAELDPLLARDIAPIDDIRSTATYRRRVLARLLHARLQEPDARAAPGV